MTDEAMTPPTKGKAKAEPKAKAEAKTGEKKERAPRKDYGYRVGAVIRINKDKETNYSGQRQAWYESLVKFDGKVVQEWEESMKGTKNNQGKVQSPRGWLRFYVLDGSVALEGGEAPAPKAKKAKEEKAA